MDKELLEAAAKAAGIDLQHRAMFGGDAEPGYYKYPPGMPPLWTWWNPLDDDGDALRLAVKLFLLEAFQLAHREVSDAVDIYVATRRAIVRAAAEIGRAMA